MGSAIRTPWAKPRSSAFLTRLAVERNVAASTQNQALSAIVFLYKRDPRAGARMALQRRAREAPGAGAGGLDRSRGAGGLGAEGRSPRPHGGDPLRCRAQAHGVRAPAGQDVDFGYSQHRPRRQGRERPARSCQPCYKQTSWPILSGSRRCIRRTWKKASARCTCPSPSPGSIRAPGGSGGDSARPVLRPAGASVPFLSRRNGGNLSFQPPSVPSIRARV
jgi:Phage integrase, N-terminal SAM-like domain